MLLHVLPQLHVPRVFGRRPACYGKQLVLIIFVFALPVHPYCRNFGHFGHVHVLRKVIAQVHHFAFIIALARAYALYNRNVRLFCLHRAYLFAHGVCALELAFKRVHMLKVRL